MVHIVILFSDVGIVSFVSVSFDGLLMTDLLVGWLVAKAHVWSSQIPRRGEPSDSARSELQERYSNYSRWTRSSHERRLYNGVMGPKILVFIVVSGSSR